MDVDIRKAFQKAEEASDEKLAAYYKSSLGFFQTIEKNPLLHEMDLFFGRHWIRIWEWYDMIEEKRQELGAPRLPWQDEVEKQRADQEALKKSSKHKTRRIFRKCPLWYVLNNWLISVKGETIEGFRTAPWQLAMRDWYRCLEVYHSSPEFRAHLSPTQRMSFTILEEWWNSAYSPASEMETTKAYLDDLAAQPEDDDDGVSRDSPKSIDFHNWPCHSKYHRQCLYLFLHEFHMLQFIPSLPRDDLVVLQGVRADTQEHAVRMRYAWTTFQSLALEKPAEEQSGLPDYIQQTRDMDWWQDNAYFQEGDQGLETHLDGLEPPLYLWDVKAKKTVRTSDFDKCPDYICVSHTWGRWTVRPPQLVQVLNVPWEIKANTLYDVCDVPEMLLGLEADYVWLDLFCLPQDASSEEHHHEVANQTAIFRLSKNCVSWLNDVEKWDITRAGLDYLALQYLKQFCVHPELEVSDELLESTFNAANAKPEIMKADMDEEPSSWFSSLWTLQETVLCPNLRLCSRTMNVLSDSSGTPISLATLLVLLPTHETTANIKTTPFVDSKVDLRTIGLPESCNMLERLRLRTNLDWVLDKLTPMDVVINSNRRMCKRSRAVAIMSALDIRDWYKERKPDKDGMISSTGYDDDEMVLGQFPLSFVREAAAKLGSAWYSAITGINENRMTKTGTLVGFPGQDVGSMMPFTRYQGWHADAAAGIMGVHLIKDDHESVASWRINKGGDVRINSAAILASSEDPEDSEEIKVALAILEDTDGKMGTGGPKYVNVDLRSKLREFAAGKSIYYAVVLYDDWGLQTGVLLQSYKTRMLTSGMKRHLMKVGTFNTIKRQNPVPCSTVNWVVV